MPTAGQIQEGIIIDDVFLPNDFCEETSPWFCLTVWYDFHGVMFPGIERVNFKSGFAHGHDMVFCVDDYSFSVNGGPLHKVTDSESRITGTLSMDLSIHDVRQPWLDTYKPRTQKQSTLQAFLAKREKRKR